MERSVDQDLEKLIQAPTTIESKSHHKKDQLCKTRAKYREGRRETAVKVYTVFDESRYLLIHGVPSLKLEKELAKLCAKYGPIEKIELAQGYPVVDSFTQVYVVKYKYLLNSIYAKKKLDDCSFMGSILHVCYAPELETIDETREKSEERRRFVRSKYEKFKPKPSTSQASTSGTGYTVEQEESSSMEDNEKLYTIRSDSLITQSLIYKWDTEKAKVQDEPHLTIKADGPFEATTIKPEEVKERHEIRSEMRVKLKESKTSPNKIRWRKK